MTKLKFTIEVDVTDADLDYFDINVDFVFELASDFEDCWVENITYDKSLYPIELHDIIDEVATDFESANTLLYKFLEKVRKDPEFYESYFF